MIARSQSQRVPKMHEEYPYQEVYERFRFKCAYCDLDCSLDFETWFRANLAIDHIKPRKHGGENTTENLALACHSCNLYKGSIDCNSIEEAREIVRRKKAEWAH